MKILSFAGRERIRWFIVSKAAATATFEERAQTAIRAAIDLQEKTGCDVAAVVLELSPKLVGTGHALALADYAPDGGGVSGKDDWRWRVEASDDRVEEVSVQIAELWYEHRSTFQTDEGLTDEPKLVSFLAKKLNLPEGEIRLPWVSRKEYRVQE